jgi:hypothetical protein
MGDQRGLYPAGEMTEKKIRIIVFDVAAFWAVNARYGARIRVPEGLFTTKRGYRRDGRAHIIELKCDTCEAMEEIDTRMVPNGRVSSAMQEKIKAHVCQKKPRQKKQDKTNEEQQSDSAGSEYSAGSLRDRAAGD